MRLRELALTDFRSYASLELTLPDGLTCIVGENGIGKTNLLESIGYLVHLKSFRGADNPTMVRVGAPRAFVRGQGSSKGRELQIEAEIPRAGRGRVQVNRQRLARTADLAAAARVSVFAPDDLATIKGSPALRRDFLDDAVVALWPRQDDTRRTLAQVLKQRNALLRNQKGRLDADASMMLDIWDERLAAAGEALGAARLSLVQELSPFVDAAYKQLSTRSDEAVALHYAPAWFEQGLEQALAAGRAEDLRRSTSTVGPHRDDLAVVLNDVPSRTHASQGEQRTLALSLRLGVHLLLTERHGESPLLLLDDVFSELDRFRTAALFEALPAGQAILTTAVALPDGADPASVLEATPGTVTPR
ncbi:MAG: DNA replication/repair protein RecF [Actinomycetota bacterium]